MKIRKINFFRNPIVWCRDKWNVGANNKAIYLVGAIPTFFAIFGFIADYYQIFHSPTGVSNLLLTFFFIYGIINLVLIAFYQRSSIRINRLKNHFNLIHTELVHLHSDYLAEWDYRASQMAEWTSIDIERYIMAMLKVFNEKYMHHVHSPDTIATIKYMYKNNLYPIRSGLDIENRSKEPEEEKVSYIYQTLNKTGKVRNHVYIRNLKKLDIYETRILGSDFDKIQARAGDHYSTFLALPIRSGELKNFSDPTFNIKRDLGFIGFDLQKKMGFGNIYKFEIDIISCLTDLIAIPLKDLIFLKQKNNE